MNELDAIFQCKIKLSIYCDISNFLMVYLQYCIIQSDRSLTDEAKVDQEAGGMSDKKPRERPNPQTSTSTSKKKFDDMSVSSYYSEDSSTHSDSGYSEGIQAQSTVVSQTKKTGKTISLPNIDNVSSATPSTAHLTAQSTTQSTAPPTVSSIASANANAITKMMYNTANNSTMTSATTLDNATKMKITASLLEQWNGESPVRKPPSTNLRRYSAAEVELIRKLILENPYVNTKSLFARFRQRFPDWKDDTESYTKFYQKKWRIGKEEEMKQQRTMHLPAAKRMKLEHNRAISLSISPSRSVSPDKMEQKESADSEQERKVKVKIPVPPLPPPPSLSQTLYCDQKR